MGFGQWKPVLTALGGTLVLGLGACSTTQTVKVSEAAPITYKVGQGSSQYASLPPSTPRTVGMPAYRHETPTARPAPQPHIEEPRTEAPQSFDLSSIDRQLYKHMKVGKPYQVRGKTYRPKHNPDYDQIGTASWYGDKFHGKPTANGEIYDKTAMTAAHKTLPLNSFVIVTNLESGKALKLRLNDRGPFVGGRIIDLSEAAANALGIKSEGLGRVRVQYAGPADPSEIGKQYQPAPAPIEEAPQQMAEDLSERPVAPRAEPEQERPTYRPLRDQAGTIAGLPEDNPYMSVPNILGPQPEPVSETPEYSPEVALPSLPAIPEPEAPTSEDGVTTLTIKGPIHMARSDEEQAKPKFIPAVYRTQTTAQK